MTFPALYRLERRGALKCPVVGVASTALSTQELAGRARAAIEESGEQVEAAVFARLAGRLTYLAGDVTDPELYKALAVQVTGARRPLYYLEVPPSLFAPIVDRLDAANLIGDGRVAVEKPFGHDLDSARELKDRLDQVLDERQLLLVDHFLGKEPVVEIEYLRFANFAMAELWDRTSIEVVQITMAEDFGVDHRGRFYDTVGALRDVVQNHLLQVLALVAMDPPIGPSADDLQDKKVEVLKAIPPVDVRHCVRGQYHGYRELPGVADGQTPRRSSRCGWTSTAGAGPECRSSSGPESICRYAPPRCGWCFETPPGCGSCPTPIGWRQTRSCCASPPIPGCG